MYRGKCKKNVGYFCKIKELPKVNNRPRGENWPNILAQYYHPA
jgi:hypothetical protein